MSIPAMNEQKQEGGSPRAGLCRPCPARLRWFLLLLGLGLLDGCALLGERPEVVVPAMPDAFVQADAVGVSAADGDRGATFEGIGDESAPLLSARWWEDFQDPVLNELIAEVLVHNPDLAAAAARREQLAAAADIAAAGLFPFLNAGGRVGRDQQQTTLGPVRSESARLSLSAGYEIDLWQKIGAGARAGRLQAEAAAFDLAALRLSLAAQAADLYFLAVEQRAQLALGEETVATLADRLARIETRYQRGLAAANDLYQARRDLLAVKEVQPGRRAHLAATNHALALLRGRFPEADGGGIAALPAPPPLPAPGLPAHLLGNRPDLAAAHLRLAARDAELAAAIADRLPAIRLTADLGRAGVSSNGLSASGLIWNLLAELTAPLVDGGRRRAEVDRRQALLTEEAANYRKTLLAAVGEVEDALVAVAASRRQLALLDEQVTTASASLRLSSRDYFAGLSDYLPVLIAQQAEIQARTRQLAVQQQLLRDYISLVRALGGGVETAEAAAAPNPAATGRSAASRRQPATN